VPSGSAIYTYRHFNVPRTGPERFCGSLLLYWRLGTYRSLAVQLGMAVVAVWIGWGRGERNMGGFGSWLHKKNIVGVFAFAPGLHDRSIMVIGFLRDNSRRFPCAVWAYTYKHVVMSRMRQTGLVILV
jgi:hypothetical protein